MAQDQDQDDLRLYCFNFNTQCLKKVTLIFTVTSAIVGQFSKFFTVKFRKDLWKKLELKLITSP